MDLLVINLVGDSGFSFVLKMVEQRLHRLLPDLCPPHESALDGASSRCDGGTAFLLRRAPYAGTERRFGCNTDSLRPLCSSVVTWIHFLERHITTRG